MKRIFYALWIGFISTMLMGFYQSLPPTLQPPFVGLVVFVLILFIKTDTVPQAKTVQEMVKETAAPSEDTAIPVAPAAVVPATSKNVFGETDPFDFFAVITLKTKWEATLKEVDSFFQHLCDQDVSNDNKILAWNITPTEITLLPSSTFVLSSAHQRVECFTLLQKMLKDHDDFYQTLFGYSKAHLIFSMRYISPFTNAHGQKGNTYFQYEIGPAVMPWNTPKGSKSNLSVLREL